MMQQMHNKNKKVILNSRFLKYENRLNKISHLDFTGNVESTTESKSSINDCQFYSTCKIEASNKSIIKKDFKDLKDSAGLCNNCCLGNSNAKKAVEQEKKTLYNDDKTFHYDNFFSEKITDKKRDGSYRHFKKVIRSAKKYDVTSKISRNFTIYF